jgi:hypothetical protein
MAEGIREWRKNVGVTDKGFISFASEKAGGKEESLGAAKVMKPCSELDLGARVDL